jgi:hypothetical protein
VTASTSRAALFPHSIVVPYRSFTIEVQRSNASAYPHLLDTLQDEALTVAAVSRGWTEREELQAFRQTFKLGPLYEANALALIRRGGILKGLAGSVNNWRSGPGSIVHLCSVGLLPEAQARGFIPCLLRLLWLLCLQDDGIRADYEAGRLYVSGITQSAYLMAMLDRLFRIFPSPARRIPEAEELEVARTVAGRFASGLTLEEDTFVLREECRFFYREEPASLQRDWNDYCRRTLRTRAGDVFVAVGRAVPERLEPYLMQVQRQYPELTRGLDTILRDAVTHG